MCVFIAAKDVYGVSSVPFRYIYRSFCLTFLMPIWNKAFVSLLAYEYFFWHGNWKRNLHYAVSGHGKNWIYSNSGGFCFALQAVTGHAYPNKRIAHYKNVFYVLSQTSWHEAGLPSLHLIVIPAKHTSSLKRWIFSPSVPFRKLKGLDISDAILWLYLKSTRDVLVLWSTIIMNKNNLSM